ncbi:MAG: dsDNA nuclease domain-containing protein [Candidatus Limnocylindrales bacterium]
MTPPDDSGSDTFARFRYQAYIAAPFALSCAIGGDVRSVVLEHVEDIAVEYAGRWQFIQVKTRDAGLRRWRMQDLCGDREARGLGYRTTAVGGQLAGLKARLGDRA